MRLSEKGSLIISQRSVLVIPILDDLRNCKFETDNYSIKSRENSWGGLSIYSTQRTAQSRKAPTYYIEGFNATIRARVSRLVRKRFHFQK